MAGFLKRVTIADDFANRVTNIHPGLIPAFCGQGFYGHHVHQAVIDYGAKLSGCTIHFADNQYDHGPVILQRAVPVLDDDTADTLAARVFEAECEAVQPAAYRDIYDLGKGLCGVTGAGFLTVGSRRCCVARSGRKMAASFLKGSTPSATRRFHSESLHARQGFAQNNFPIVVGRTKVRPTSCS